MKHRAIFTLLLLIIPFSLYAHVKWFVDFDTTKEPESILVILKNLAFLGLLVLSVVVIFLTSLLDRKWSSPVDNEAWKPALTKLHNAIPVLMRFGTSAFFSFWHSSSLT